MIDSRPRRIIPKIWPIPRSLARGPILRETALIYVALAFSALFPIIISPLIVRTNGVQFFGEYSLLVLIGQVASIVTEYSFDAIGTRTISGCKSVDQRISVYGSILSAKIILLPVALGVAELLSLFIFGRHLSVIGVLGVALTILGTALQANWFAIATTRSVMLAKVTLVGRGVSALTIVSYLLIDDPSPSVTFLWTAFGTLVGGLWFAIMSKVPSRFWNYSGGMSALREGLPAFSGVAASAIQNALGQAIVGRYVGVTGAGNFSAVDRISRSLSRALKPIFMVMFPRMAIYHIERQEVAIRLMLFAKIAWVVFSSVAMAITFIFGDKLLWVLYGPASIEFSDLLVPLVGWLCFGLLNNVMGIQGLLAAGYDKQYSIGMWIGTVLTVLTSAILLSVNLSAISVAQAVAVSEASVSFYFIFVGLKVWRQR